MNNLLKAIAVITIVILMQGCSTNLTAQGGNAEVSATAAVQFTNKAKMPVDLPLITQANPLNHSPVVMPKKLVIIPQKGLMCAEYSIVNAMINRYNRKVNPADITKILAKTKHWLGMPNWNDMTQAAIALNIHKRSYIGACKPNSLRNAVGGLLNGGGHWAYVLPNGQRADSLYGLLSPTNAPAYCVELK